MSRLWLTYAWKDNEVEQVDYVINALKGAGLEVQFDRTRLVPGQRLWPQIDAAISDTDTSAWAIYVTKSSLESEPCQEELAYALDRALRTRGQTFPIIGIFPEQLDRSLIPSAIATRLWVSLQHPGWVEQVVAGVEGVAPEVSTNVAPYIISQHSEGDKTVIEIRPRGGRWYPFWVLVPEDEFDCISRIAHGPFGKLPGATMVSRNEVKVETADQKLKGIRIHHAVDFLNSAFIYFSRRPTFVVLGEAEGVSYRFGG